LFLNIQKTFADQVIFTKRKKLVKSEKKEISKNLNSTLFDTNLTD